MNQHFQLTATQVDLLSKGLTFIPAPQDFNKYRLLQDLHSYHRRIKLLDFFDFESSGGPIPFQLPSNWEPPENQISPLIREYCEKDYNCLVT